MGLPFPSVCFYHEPLSSSDDFSITTPERTAPVTPAEPVIDSALAFLQIGWSGATAAPTPNLRLARIIEQHRSGFVLDDGLTQFTAIAHPKLRHVKALMRPAVGDFVWLDSQLEMFEQILPRRTELKRAAAGERYAEQVLASNVDKVIIVCGLDRDFSARRIERYLTLIHGCQIAASIVLSKADTTPEAAAMLKELIERIGATVPIYAMDVRDPLAVACLESELPPGCTGVLLGSSGAGKSTLSNALLGTTAMQTGRVRASDGRGRHTTVHRALLKLSWGACLIDSPGLREIKLTGEEEVGAQTFADITELAETCKFRDCAHEAEPGCAVQAAIVSGRISADRLVSFKKLQAEAKTARERAAEAGQNGRGSSRRTLRR